MLSHSCELVLPSVIEPHKARFFAKFSAQRAPASMDMKGGKEGRKEGKVRSDLLPLQPHSRRRNNEEGEGGRNV